MVALNPQPRHPDENQHIQHVRNTHTSQPQMGRSCHLSRQHSAAKANPLLPAQGRTSKRWQTQTSFQRYHQGKPGTERDSARELGQNS